MVGETRRVRGMRYRAEARARLRAEDDGKELDFGHSSFDSWCHGKRPKQLGIFKCYLLGLV